MADLNDRVVSALADRYRIERTLGAGGMAIVYLGVDLKHGRQVAIKVLRPEIAATVGAERFLREIRIIAGLSHPNILPLHDSGEAGGFLYYVMPYVEGDTLRRRLEREPRLPVAEAIQIARDVADALEYAGSQGVIHRDIKPENILLSGPRAVLADFGIARGGTAADNPALTSAGFAVGTPAYMSPEQATAAPVDIRTDIYSLGCVLYEALSGHPPFAGSTPAELMARHSLDPAPPLRGERAEIPVHVEQAVRRAMAKSPADRFAGPAEFSRSLVSAGPSPRRTGLITLGFLAVLLVVASGWFFRSRTSAGPAMVAVMPFENVGNDPANEPFSDGMADELTTQLGRVSGLAITPRASAFSFKGQRLGPRDIGRKLGVRYLVGGSVRRAGNQIRIRAELIDVATGAAPWSDEYDGQVNGTFTVQDSIASSIMTHLRLHLSATATELTGRRTTDAAAHDLYLQGRYYFEKRDSTGLRKAREFFEQAIARDSSYALAYAGLADAYSQSSVFGHVTPGQVYGKAKAAAVRALALDPKLVEAHTALGFLALFFDWDWPAAGRELERAIALDPRYPLAHLIRAWYFVAVDSLDQAVASARRAVDLDPFSTIARARLIDMLIFAGRAGEGLAEAERLRAIDSTHFQVGAVRLKAYLSLGRCAEAMQVVDQVAKQRASMYRGLRGAAFARCGQRTRALAELQDLAREAGGGGYVSHFGPATIQAALGERDRALAELDSTVAERGWGILTVRVEPAFDFLRADPRFTAILVRIGYRRP